MKLRRFSELPEHQRAKPPSSPSSSSSCASSPPRKRLRRFSETPSRRPALERLATVRRTRAATPESENSEEAGESDAWMVSDASSESEISFGYYAAADREIFSEKFPESGCQQYVEMAAGRNFRVYVEYVAFALAAFGAMAETETKAGGWSADEISRFSGAVRKFEKEILTRRDAASGRWPPAMREAVEKFPSLQLSRECFAPGTLCEACNRKGDTCVEGMLSGNPVDTRKFHGRVLTDLLQASQAAVEEFLAVRAATLNACENFHVTLSAHCAKKVEQYHRLHHWKWRIFSAVYRWLIENRNAYETPLQAAQVLACDTAFIQRIDALNNALFGDQDLSD